MKIWEIDEAIRACFREEEHPITGEIEIRVDGEALKALQMERDKKIENLACYAKNELSDAEQLRKEAKKLIERAEGKEKRAEGCKRALVYFLDGEPFDGTRATVRIHKSRAVEILDDERIPPAYKEVKTSTSILKTVIRYELELGHEVPGAVLVTRESAVIK